MTTLLLSGGLDSAVCLAMERPDRALFVNYEQPHVLVEYQCAKALARKFDVPFEDDYVGIHAWKYLDRADPTMLVPGRNLVLLAIAATYGDSVVIGCNSADYEIYADCRPEFFESLGSVQVLTPLINMNKRMIGAAARSLGLDDDETWSCYYPADGVPCNQCDACKGRREALA